MSSFATETNNEMERRRPVAVRFEGDKFFVELADGRSLGVPLSWFPMLEAASPEQREKVWFSTGGLHWDEIDEDISIGGLLEGRGDATKRGGKRTAAE
jgi:hypothetical protein